MATLDWSIDWNAQTRQPVQLSPPTLQDMSGALANLSAALFWLGSCSCARHMSAVS
jgi:hypothetical protein